MSELISAIIPVKNGANYLAEAILGIKRQAMNIEIIVVDDASTDATATIAHNLGCRIIRHEKTFGQVVGKNTGLKAAQGKFILFHDHDDVMRTGVLSKMYRELEKNCDAHAVIAKVKDFFSPELSEEDRNRTAIKTEPYYGLFTGAVLIRKSVFKLIGPFVENINTGDMIYFDSKLKEHHCKMIRLDIIATDRRIHTTNYGRTHRAVEYENYSAILRKKLDR